MNVVNSIMRIKQLALTLFLVGLSAGTLASVALKTHPSNLDMVVDQYLNAGARFDIKIYNETDEVKTYEYHASMCIPGFVCQLRDKTNIQIAPKQWFVETITINKMVHYKIPGDYIDKCFIRVTGNETVEQGRNGLISVHWPH